MARLENTSYEPTTTPTGDYLQDVYAEDRKVREEGQEALANYKETGKLIGLHYRAPFADSYALYRVTKERPFTVQHVATGDAWHLPRPHIKGLTAADIRQQADADLSYQALLAHREQQKG